MPGRRLNDTERHLVAQWSNPAAYGGPRLTGIEIAGNRGLRGLRGIAVPFRYPLTAICGSNGAGKTTILSLAALAFHSPSQWFVHWGVGRGRSDIGDRTIYRFGDFFLTSTGEPALADVSVTWRYARPQGDDSLTAVKSAKRWVRYDRRPERPVDFLPLARILPAVEMARLAKLFREPPASLQVVPLNASYLAHLGNIMGRNYTSAEVLKQGDLMFARCESGSRYSSFNMGAGEAAIIGLLALLQRMPDEGLLVVEEIDAGLHPQAHARLAQVLLGICETKRLQIICSSHSEVFLDAIPRQARLLLNRSGGNVEVIEGPSTRFCLAKMIGVAQAEVVIFCEDTVAETFIRTALASEVMPRVRIVPIGDGATIVSQGVSHVRGGNPGRVLCVFDGDTQDADVGRWFNRHDPQGQWPFGHLTLPGNVSPERWIIQMLQLDDYADALSTQLACGRGEARTHIQQITALPDPHEAWRQLGLRTGRPEDECMRFAVRAAVDRNPGLDPLRDRVNALLG
ncbi:MAG TPA: AAA family ATPase [Candidatus Acidoferrales bacterium]|nr:AAA family ATPase [Candidatus Acidoferrales bacterium]